MNRQADVLYEERFLPAIEVVEMRMDLLEARALLLAMIHELDDKNRSKLHKRIEAVSRELDQKLDYYQK